MAKVINWLRNPDGLTILNYQKKPLTIHSSHPNYKEILKALQNNDFDELEKFADTSKSINEAGKSKTFSYRRIFVKNGHISFTPRNGEPIRLHGTLVKKVMEDLNKGFKPDSLLKFLDNLMDNPSAHVQSELYDFLTSGKITITGDGHILAYKKVRQDFLDIYTGTMSNEPGRVVLMDRSKVDPDRRNECSHGLHFCSLNYLSSYGSCYDNKVVIVKINPKDIVAIPADYQYQKGRTCKYEVVGEYTGELAKDAFEKNFITEANKNTSTNNIKWFAPSQKESKSKVLNKASKFSIEENLVDLDGKLEVYRKVVGDKPRAIRRDLDGKARDARTGQFIPKLSKVSFMKLKSFKDAVRY